MNQDLINNDLQKFEVEDKYKVDFVIDFILMSFMFIFPLLLLLFFLIFMPHVLLEYKNILVILVIMGFLYVLGIPIFRKFIKNRYPIHFVKFIITKECIEIKIRNYSYIKFLWADIIKIEVINETFYPYLKPRNCYKLFIKKMDESKEVRLFLFDFRKKNTILILESIKKFSKLLKKEFIRIKEVEKRDFRDKQQLNDLRDIRNFKQKK